MNLVMQEIRALVVLLLATLVLLVSHTAPAGAEAPENASSGSPERFTFVDQGTFPIEDCSFPAEITVDLVHELSYYFDRSGEQWKGSHHIKGTYVFRNLATGYTLESRTAALARAYDFVRDLTYDDLGRRSGTVTWTRSNQGMHAPLNVPGEGRVLYDVGRLTFSITASWQDGVFLGRTEGQLTESGKWSGWGFPDLCPYLDR